MDRGVTSIAISPDALRVEEIGVVQWRTVNALPGASLFGVSAEGVNLRFGGSHFDGMWLAGAMALLATLPQLLVHLFALTDHLDRSPTIWTAASLRCASSSMAHGSRSPSTVLPSGPDGKVTLCSSVAVDELWPALLTKVVKLYGSYAALDGGDLVRHARPRRRATPTPHAPPHDSRTSVARIQNTSGRVQLG